MDLKPGQRLWSPVSSAAVIVVKAPAEPVELRCGGTLMVASPQEGPSTDGGSVGERVELGKRYTDAAGRVELVCTKAGAGPLTLDGVELAVKAARPLPASD